MLDYLSPERRQEADDATTERLIVLFYDQVTDELHTAISTIARKDVQQRCNALTAAIKLLGDMLQCFELESDDVIVTNLRQIHTFIIARLPQVNLHNDAKFVAESIRLLKTLRDAWSVVDKVSKEPTRPPHPAIILPTGRGRPKLTLVGPAA